MYLHHGTALIYKHLRKLLKCQHVLVQVNLALALLLTLSDGDAVKSSRGHRGESRGHYRRQELGLQRDEVFVGNVPYTPCHRQTTFQHHAVRLERIQAGYRHVLQYAYHDHHHQKQLSRSMGNQFL